MIVVFGSLNADIIFTLPALPTPGQTVLATGLAVEAGGKGANQAAAAALDGAQVRMAGAVGSDALAETALAGLRQAGVDTSRVATVPGATGCAAISTDAEGRNQIVVAPAANFAARAEWVGDDLLQPGAILVTQMETDPAQTAALLRRARARGVCTIHNLAPAGPLPGDALRAVDILVVNEDEAEWLASAHALRAATAAALAALGPTVVRTLGAGGAEWAGARGAGHCQAAPIRAIDTTAAGDCFVGVLAAALDRGAAFPDAVARANQAAALACTRRGSQGSLPCAAETDGALTQRSHPA